MTRALACVLLLGCHGSLTLTGRLRPARNGAAPCLLSAATIDCSANNLELAGRRVFWKAPRVVPAPAAGFPVVVLYQGSFAPPSVTWAPVGRGAAYGAYHQARLQAMLVEHGFVVIAPTAALGVAWQSNMLVPWGLSSDRVFLERLFGEMRRGTFGRLDVTRWYATGISSGGYLTSRMALNYPGHFRALAIQSASWANCAGPVCSVPRLLPRDHPPTLLLHGLRDTVVPVSTARAYVDQLVAEGHVAQLVVDGSAGHQWLEQAPEAIVSWFEEH